MPRTILEGESSNDRQEPTDEQKQCQKDHRKQYWENNKEKLKE